MHVKIYFFSRGPARSVFIVGGKIQGSADGRLPYKLTCCFRRVPSVQVQCKQHICPAPPCPDPAPALPATGAGERAFLHW